MRRTPELLKDGLVIESQGRNPKHQAFNCGLDYLRLVEALCDKKATLELPLVFVVNISFSIELFLKCLCMEHNNFDVANYPRGHDLSELFEMLPSEVADRVESQFQKRTKNKYGTFQSTVGDVNVKKVFEEWRYIYEKHGKRNWADPAMLYALSATLYDVNVELVPDFCPRDHDKHED